MMDRALSQALSSLIPTHSLPLPTPLVDLSTSLLAQSRIQARSLKADEEIARSYACAHLACERLKISLALPKIQPRPPCPPRIYQKLYRYFDSTLVTASPRRSTRTHNDNKTKKNETPSKTLRAAGSNPETPAEQSKGNSNGSAGKLKRPSYRRTAVGNRNEEQEENLVPQWVMPAIRLLCEKFGAPAAPPHIYAGVSSILTLAETGQFQGTDGSAKSEKGEEPPLRRRAKNPRKRSTKITALIVAVGLLVCACLSGKTTSPAEYARQKILGLDSLRGRFPPADAVAVRTRQEEEMKDDDNSFDNPAHVDAWLREIRDQRLTEMDWFKNVGQGTGLNVTNGGEDEDGEEGHQKGNEEEADEGLWTARRRLEDGEEGKEYLQAGLGTMMQDKLDYLSEGRQRDYERWKRGMMIRIEKMEKEHEMNVSDG